MNRDHLRQRARDAQHIALTDPDPAARDRARAILQTWAAHMEAVIARQRADEWERVVIDDEGVNPETAVVWNGQLYPSQAAAAEAWGHSKRTMCNWINRGLTCDDDVPPKQARPISWNGVLYPSIGAAHRATGYARKTLSDWVAQGYTCDDDVPSLRKQAS